MVVDYPGNRILAVRGIVTQMCAMPDTEEALQARIKDANFLIRELSL
jgi:hypothetical protein